MRPGLLLSIAMACGMLQSRPLAADPMPEYAMKAAYLYNFALFTEWPALPDNQLNLCLLGKDSFGAALESIDGKLVNDLRLSVHRISGSSSAKHCQILFLGTTDGINIHRLLHDIEDEPVLTVTDNDDLVQAGIMIRMSIENKRLIFDINTEAARRARLAISSKLLRLAKTVY